MGDIVKLSGFAGTGVAYQWYLNGIAHSTAPFIADGGLTAGTYYYQLVITISDTTGLTITPCSDTSGVDTVYVHSAPAPPTITGPVVIDCNSYHLQLTASEPVSGTYNWSNGTYGAVDSIFSGGPYRVWFTDINGCVSHADTLVPMSPDTYFPYFPVGCYTLCSQQLPLKLYGPPDVVFSYWAWLVDTAVADSGSHSIMASYSIDSAGVYQWTLDNGLCAQTSGNMNVDVINCNRCREDSFTVKIVCDTGNPASYLILITLYSPAAGATYTLGTDMGPIDPFSGTLPSAGPQPPITLSFTTLTLPPPDSVTVEVIYTLPDGTKCFHKQRIKLPHCSWIEEKPGDSSGSAGLTTTAGLIITSALLVFPNPTSGDVIISYDYGTPLDNAHGDRQERNIAIYDAMGRKKDFTTPTDVHGNWILNTKDWTPGIYIIRMEVDGKALQIQQMVVVSR